MQSRKKTGRGTVSEHSACVSLMNLCNDHTQQVKFPLTVTPRAGRQKRMKTKRAMVAEARPGCSSLACLTARLCSMDDVFGCVWERFSVFPVQYISTVSSAEAQPAGRWPRGGRALGGGVEGRTLVPLQSHPPHPARTGRSRANVRIKDGHQARPPMAAAAKGAREAARQQAPCASPNPTKTSQPAPPARPSSQLPALDGWAHDGRSLEMQLGLGVQSINEGQGDIHSFEVEDRGKPKGRTSSARPPALRPKAGGSLARDDLLSLDSPASAALRWTVASWAHARSLETQFQSKSPRRESEPRKSQGQTQGRKGETQKQPVKIICCLKPKLPHW